MVRYLGVFLDKKLTFGHHIKSLADTCKKRLNIIKCLSNITWGADRETLISLHSKLILSKIDYGCVVYSGAAESHLKKIDAVNHMGIRYATGAFRTTPVQSLYCDAGIPPLKIRRKTILLKYITELRAKPNHINYCTFFDVINTNQAETLKESKRTASSAKIAKRFLQETNININDVYLYDLYRTPPWIMAEVRTSTDMSEYKKCETDSRIYQGLWQDMVSDYSEPELLYTDGSKTNSGVASAMYSDMETRSWTLPKQAAITSAEMHAIWQALIYSSNSSRKKTIIIGTDSLTAINSIRDTYTTDPVAYNIILTIHEMTISGKEVIIMWTPGHVGIQGNEEADKAAKKATHKAITVSSISITDVRNTIKQLCKQQWQQTWEETNTHLKQVKATVDKWYMPRILTRKEQTAITRLRLGHAYFSTGYLLKRENQPQCDKCKVNMTVKHLIEECRKYEKQRKQYGLEQTIAKALSNDEKIITEHTLPYIKAIGYMEKI
ncbi:uncharacterized protein LOC143266274 [Megachile rotundata]|uniref:uncharacterized protein LOC143266274 n=1 Tax=Megachile rotundata TaxID=143995 RepID=UPI003FD0A72B